MLERERWPGVPNGLQEGIDAKAVVLHKRDAQATAAFWRGFSFSQQHTRVPQSPPEKKKKIKICKLSLIFLSSSISARKAILPDKVPAKHPSSTPPQRHHFSHSSHPFVQKKLSTCSGTETLPPRCLAIRASLQPPPFQPPGFWPIKPR